MGAKKTVKKVAAKKPVAKKKPASKHHKHDQKKIEKSLGIAREIMEHKVEGFLIIAKITDKPEEDGFQMEGSVVVNGVNQSRIAHVVMDSFNMSPIPFMMVGHLPRKSR